MAKVRQNLLIAGWGCSCTEVAKHFRDLNLPKRKCSNFAIRHLPSPHFYHQCCSIQKEYYSEELGRFEGRKNVPAQ